ncbi:MAG: hypothetical protein LBF67_00215 [Prevotellaceae bacterium]|nr:hypothetical protein [Prevotellaceae bacterium]
MPANQKHLFVAQQAVKDGLLAALKTAWWMIRLTATISAMALNAILPDSAGDTSIKKERKKVQLEEDNFLAALTHWAFSTLSLSVKMFAIIVVLTVLQRVLAELGLLNHHIAASHSNIEDVALFFSIGASLFWMLALRIVFAIAVVWERRLVGVVFKKRQPPANLASS